MAERILEAYAGLVCDLDGVVYAGPDAIEHAVESLEAAADRGLAVVYATNNASRPPRDVAAHLRRLGLRAEMDDVVNSSMAAASVLRSCRPDALSVLPVGGPGVAMALHDAGFECAEIDTEEIDAVVQGYGPDVRASDLAAAAQAIQRGALWVATNTDLTLPTDKGIAPGNGSLVQAVRNAVDRDPEVAGKPMPVVYDMAAHRMDDVERARVLAIGDRLETDIEGAGRGGYDSVLVLTGVHGWADAAAAPPLRRPSFVVDDLRGLFEPYEVDDWDPALCGRAQAPALRGLLHELWSRVDAGELDADGARAEMGRALGDDQAVSS